MKYPEQESSLVEWKQTLPRHDQIIKTVIGFCNQNGGKLVIGVDDRGTIVGILGDKLQQWMEYLDKLIYEASSPPIIPQVYSQRIGDKTILIIEVSSGMNKPYFFKTEGLERGTYIRLGRSTLRADTNTIQELKWLSQARSFDIMPVHHATEKAIDLDRLRAFMKESRAVPQASVTKSILQAYHLLTEEHNKTYPTVAGVLLFGHEPQRYLSEAFILCSHFKGISGRDVIATTDCTGTLFEQFEGAYEFLISRLNRSFVIKGKKRLEELEMPNVAIREILLNAVVHRNYHLAGPIKVAIYDNRVEVFSPGSFPGPLDPNNLRMGLTYIRNGALCKVFREAGYIEKLGSGFITVFDSFEKGGLKVPQVLEGENFVKCILPRGASGVIEEADQKKKILSLFDISQAITIGDVINALNIPRATAGRRLTELVESGLIVKEGSARATHYRKR